MKRSSIQERINFSPREGAKVLWNHSSDFTPCECSTHSFASVPAVPVEVRPTVRGVRYRCLVCGGVFTQGWMRRHKIQLGVELQI